MNPPERASQTPPPMPRPDWLSRNWKWAVPVFTLGCFSIIGLFIFGFASLLFGAMKSSEPYKDSVARAVAHPQVTEALGTPVESGFFISGSIATSGNSGSADLEIPISGPKGKGRIHVKGEKSGGIWSYSVMNVRISGSPDRIELPR